VGCNLITRRIIYLLFGFLFLGYIILSCIFEILRNEIVTSFVAASYGTLIGVIISFNFQLGMERSRYFQMILEKILQVLAEDTAWKLENNDWKNLEFRSAVGLATWVNEPSNHLNLHISKLNIPIDWKGVVYNIDEKFCVASKSLHDYTVWFRMVIEGYTNRLLRESHIRMLWRQIGNSLYPAGRFSSSEPETKGMRPWLEYFLLGSVIYREDDIESSFREEYKNYMRVRKIIENYGPIQESYIKKEKGYNS